MNTHWDEVDHHPGRPPVPRRPGRGPRGWPSRPVPTPCRHRLQPFPRLLPRPDAGFTVGVGEVNGAGRGRHAGGPLPVDTGAGPAPGGLAGRCRVRPGVLAAAAASTTASPHSLSTWCRRLDVPIVPLVVNVFAPPLPSLRRCDELGAASAAALRSDGADKRVAVIASGGLSHRLPWPKWYDALSDDDQFLVRRWLNGRDSWRSTRSAAARSSGRPKPTSTPTSTTGSWTC